MKTLTISIAALMLGMAVPALASDDGREHRGREHSEYSDRKSGEHREYSSRRHDDDDDDGEHDRKREKSEHRDRKDGDDQKSNRDRRS